MSDADENNGRAVHDHARIASRHVTMKNLDRRKAGAALVAEGLALIYGIDADSAGLLAKVCGGRPRQLK